jgi:hypothetical protein
MNHRLLIYSLVMLFVAGTSDSWSQDSVKTAYRRESLIDLFQQRLCGILCDCHPPTKTAHHAGAKKSAVQKSSVQKGLCRREVSDMEVACELCSPARARPVADMMTRWTGTLPQIFPRLAETPSSKGGKSTVKGDAVQRSSKACHCQVDSPVQVDSTTPPLLPIPEIEKPQIDANPFQDDALQPAPSPRAGTRQATDLSTPGREDPMADSDHQPIIRQAVHYHLPVHLD